MPPPVESPEAESAVPHAVLLLTDVVDSTSITETLGDARAAALWAEHDAVSRSLLGRHGGREIDKSDGFLLLFDHADDAVAYARSYHAALATLDPPLSARAGVHVGSVQLVASPEADVARGAKPLEVVGVAKAVAARIMSAAAGSTTLLSADARAAFSGDACSVGHWHLKGVTEPLELFRVGTDPAPPPDASKVWRVVRHGTGWRPAREIPHALPAERDAFVGRTADLASLAGRIAAGDRLVSVHGIGGAGKTRFALHYAWTFLADFPGGAWFCDLSEARDAEGIVSTLSRVLGVPLGSGPGALPQLAEAIHARGRILLVLDNFEQVVPHAREVLSPLIDRAAEACFLVTTREALGLPGETVFQLPTLDEAEATALFEARARAASQRVDLSDTAALTQLVTLLDRLPLAIELAAARCRMMSPATILERMGERFRLLRAKGRVERQATLEATIDWSWQLLSDPERSALAQLSVFEGGFDMAAVEAVLEVPDAYPDDLLASLIDKSLVRVVDDDRFDLLVSVQAFATARLTDPEACWARHSATFAEPIRQIEPSAAEVPNFIAAAHRALEAGWLEQASRLAEGWLAISQYTTMSSALETFTERIAAMAEPGSLAWARAQTTRGAYLADIGDFQTSLSLLEASLGALEAHHDELTSINAHMAMGYALGRQGSHEAAKQHLKAAVAQSMAADNPLLRRLEPALLTNLAICYFPTPVEALSHVQRALDSARAHGNLLHVGMNLNNLAHLLTEMGELERARTALSEAAPLNRAVGNRRSEASSRVNLARVQCESGSLEFADLYRESIELYAIVGATSYVAMGSRMAAVDLAALGLLDEAAAYATRACDGLSGPDLASALATLADILCQQGDLEGAQTRHTEGTAEADAFPEDDAVAEQLALVQARLLLAQGDPHGALSTLDALHTDHPSRRESVVRRSVIEADALYQVGRVDDAHAVLDRLDAFLPADAPLWHRWLASSRNRLPSPE